MKLFAKNRKGFTLTELMVVVVILGILVAIAIPVYNGLDAKAKEAAEEANIRTITSAVLQYCLEENVDQTGLSITATVGSSGVILDIKIPGVTNPSPIVPKYLNEWPVRPNNDQQSYNVTGNASGITVTPES